MSEYWKSTPKYWCKHCSVFVRDTKLERSNHEATGRHQGAIKRSLRELHRSHESEGRDKERARAEIERVSGVVAGTAAGAARGGAISGGRGARGTTAAGGGGKVSEAERKKQVEQLNALGVSVPDEFRGDLALAGEWTVTSTRVVADVADGDVSREAVAVGVRKREREVKDEDGEGGDEVELKGEDVVGGLFKKPRRWGRDERLGGGGDEGLDALLSGALVKKEEQIAESTKTAAVPDTVLASEPKPVAMGAALPKPDLAVKDELGSAEMPGLDSLPQADAPSEAPAVVFKKRKGKPSTQR